MAVLFAFGLAPSADAAPAHVGYLGCSNTSDIVGGYHVDGGQKLWPSIPQYGGMTVLSWGDKAGGGPAMNAFKAKLAQFPTRTFWFQLCEKAAETNEAANYRAAVKIINTVRGLVPGATIYVSALNGYAAPHVCSITGPTGPQRAQELAARLVAEGQAKLGPHIGDLSSTEQIPSLLPPGDETAADGCHPNNAGRAKLGETLLKFFG